MIDNAPVWNLTKVLSNKCHRTSAYVCLFVINKKSDESITDCLYNQILIFND